METFETIKTQVQDWHNKREDVSIATADLEMSDQYQMCVQRKILPLSDHGVFQLCDKLRIPLGYYNRLPNDMAIQQVDYWKSREQFRDKQLRLKLHQDDGVIGIVTDKHVPVANTSLIEGIEAVATKSKVDAFILTNEKLYLRLVFPDITKTLKDYKNDVVKAGIQVINSEVGSSRLFISPVIWRQVCSNGLVIADTSNRLINRIHRNKKEGISIEEQLSQIFPLNGDLYNDLFSQFFKLDYKITKRPAKEIIAEINKQFNFTQKFGEDVLQSLDIEIQERNKKIEDTTMYDVVNAYTRSAQKLPNFDNRLNVESKIATLIK